MTPEQHTPQTAADPRTPLGELAQIAASRPDLRAAVAANPAAYPDLLRWLAGLGDPAVDAALRSRGPGTVPSPAPPAGTSAPVGAPAPLPSPFAPPGSPAYAYDPHATPAPRSSSGKVVGIVVGVVALLVVLGVVAAAWFVSAVRGQVPEQGEGTAIEELHDRCAAGDGQACDDLYFQAPEGSDEQQFADTCGGRTEGGTMCVEELGPPGDAGDPGDPGDPGDQDGSGTYGSDPALDALWDACADGDTQACTDLFYDSPFASEYEYFGSTCGQREPEGSCV